MVDTSPTDGAETRRGLDMLIIDIATDLMGVPMSDAEKATNGVLDRLVQFFHVDQTFIRRNRPDRVSELVTIWPEREVVPSPDPLQEIPADSDPVFQVLEHLKEPFILYPEGSQQIQELVQEGVGIEKASFATVPLLREGDTVGILGLVRFTDQRWSDEEVRTLFAIATLLAQFWSRLDAESLLAHRAHYDELTGLPNRLKLSDELDACPSDERVSILMIDIDNMKVINDGLDFEMGNRFIAGFADRLAATVRRDAIAARLTGDQFAVLVRDSDPDGVVALAARLVDDLSRSIDLGEITIARSVSIGVAHRSDAADRDLFAEADAALHLAKKDGKNRFRVFDGEMRRNVIQNFEMELQLRRAMENGEFVLHYQPAIDLRAGEVLAVEALLRWRHPSGDLVSAGMFIETAEESGLVVEIGDFVLAEAIRQLAVWQTSYPDLEMWINISPAQLMSRDLADQVAELIRKHDVDPSRVCLEVTEHVVVSDIESATGVLNRLRSMGVQLALDDFGTGYSSMKQLKRLPVDCLKIDMTFVAGLGKSEHDAAIVDAAITLAAAFGLNTVAEGVETDEQVDELLNRGCTKAQGFLLAKPQGAGDVEAILRDPLVQSDSRRAGLRRLELPSG